MTQLTVRYHQLEPAARQRADGWWVLSVSVEDAAGAKVNVHGLVDPANYDLVLVDVPEDRLWPAVARWMLFDLPGLCDGGLPPDGAELLVPAHQVRLWARDVDTELVGIDSGERIGVFAA